jgi:hypothetical protein
MKIPKPVQPAILADEDDATWNDDIIEDVNAKADADLVVYSRDWTIETIVNQIAQDNIDLNPKFQRRNVWDDVRRSKLIESLVAGLPVPEVVLAEDPKRKKAFLVIDGKQRLLTIAGFVDPTIGYWRKAELQKLKLLTDLNGHTFDQLEKDPALSDKYREFMNADLRCTIISKAKSDDALYDIFHRLNSGSVPLSTQELRQVLHKGPFADYLITVTNKPLPLHSVLGSNGPDVRLKDAEIVLRFVAIVLFGDRYQGNLKRFLDDTMETVTKDWAEWQPKVQSVVDQLNSSIATMTGVFSARKVGRKFVDGKWEPRFNRVLFEVEAFYFRFVPRDAAKTKRKEFLDGFQLLCAEDRDFRSSIETTTKTNERYELRFKKFQNLINRTYHKKLNDVPITA